MNRLWDIIIRPIIESIDAEYIVEIGSEKGINTKNILEYCEEHDARMTAIDPYPLFDVDEFKNKFGDKFEIYKELSLSVLPILKDYDVIIVDGDHNWYTVYNELKIIEKSFKKVDFPLVFVHDVGWPYGRRDLYYNPTNVPEYFRQPYKKLGVYPGQTDLKNQGGLNHQLYNSVYENNPKNGVLTALEDFIDESELELSYKIIPIYYGLSILYPENDEIKSIVENIIKSTDLLDILEKERVKLSILHSESINKNNELKTHLGRIKEDKTKISQEYQRIQDKNQLLQDQLRRIEQERTKITHEYLQAHENNQELQDQLGRIGDENQLLQQRLNHEMGNVENLEHQLKTAKLLIKEKERLIELFEEKNFRNDELKVQMNRLTANLCLMEYLNNNHRSLTQRLFSKFPSLYILSKMNKTGFKNALINIKGYRSIKENNLFDLGYYLKNNGDIRLSGADPILHYIYYGFNEGRKPSALFDDYYYLKTYKDIRNSNLNPLVHYALYGMKEERKIKSEYQQMPKKISNPQKTPQTYEETQEYQKLEQIKQENNKSKICDKNASILDLHQFKGNSPRVSIIILNRNGIKHLKRLFKDFHENIQYPSYEIVVVDNASSDESIQFLEDLKKNLPLKIIKNRENKTFSRANNEAVQIAQGEYVLFLNNDVEPTYGWLNQMMQVALSSDDIGAVGAKLVYPDCSPSIYNKHNSFKLQHTGIGFKIEDGFIKPYNLGNGDYFDEKDYMNKERAAVTAAALLVKKDKYVEVNGMDKRYNYGYEDVDLCLKFLKAGYKNIYCPKALLFHYEFGTQETNNKSEVSDRRLKNKELFIQKWNKWLKKEYLRDKLENNGLFSENPLKIALVVSEVGDNVSAGDYFTALELGEGLKELGWELSFLSRKGGPGDWYNVNDDVDILISFLDSYDPRKIQCANEYLIKIAWARNWFIRWVENPALSSYDIILASSETACNYIDEKSGMKTILLPIATNWERFNSDINPSKKYRGDYCFTGSYWNDPRDIIDMLEPATLPYDFKLYGKNWDSLDKFKDYNQGFLDYSKLPEVYASTKIVIDDANRVTKDFGAVNSRVYDALASGALVLTNGVIGAQETFEGNLPSFSSKEELNELLNYYLNNEDERLAKVKLLQEMVLKNHTYSNRALRLKEILGVFLVKTKIAIKIPAPNWENIQEWGDYHLALGLKKELERKDCAVKLQVLCEWNEDNHCDVVLVLRGLSKYRPQKQHFNIMWNISHPEKITLDEYNQYDHVFIASECYAQKISEQVNVPVEPLLQCTDPELFYPDYSAEYKHDLLFVGNSRKLFRKIIKDLMPTDKDIAVYGTNWNGLIDKKYIKGEHIPNNELRKAYSSCKILLNDHWDDMRENGFISNRIFDGFASGAFIISDKVKGAADIFDDALVTYDTPEQLKEFVDYYLNNETERINKLKKGKNSVREHSYQNRIEPILNAISNSICH